MQRSPVWSAAQLGSGSSCLPKKLNAAEKACHKGLEGLASLMQIRAMILKEALEVFEAWIPHAASRDLRSGCGEFSHVFRGRIHCW